MQKVLELFHILMNIVYYIQQKSKMRINIFPVSSLFSTLMRYHYWFAFHVDASGQFKVQAKSRKKVQ